MDISQGLSEAHEDMDTGVPLSDLTQWVQPAEVSVYKAERIIKRRIRKGQLQYLIKWSGYSSQDNTWEPEKNIIDRNLIYDFKAREAVKESRKVKVGRGGKRRSLSAVDPNNNVGVFRETHVHMGKFKHQTSVNLETKSDMEPVHSPFGTPDSTVDSEISETCSKLPCEGLDSARGSPCSVKPARDSPCPSEQSNSDPPSPNTLWRPWQHVLVTEVTCQNQSVTIFESDYPEGFFGVSAAQANFELK